VREACWLNLAVNHYGNVARPSERLIDMDSVLVQVGGGINILLAWQVDEYFKFQHFDTVDVTLRSTRSFDGSKMNL
jgi:hypothetical protein